MNEFGALLQSYRQKCRDPQSGRTLTQERLAEQLSLAAQIDGYSGSTVSNWERGHNQIRRDDRHVLVGLITVLHQYGGINTAKEANRLLLVGNYRPLDNEELHRVDPAWKRAKLKGINISSFPTSDDQEAQLPAPTYTRLFGVTATIDQLMALLLTPKPPYLLALVGLGGLGKTALADAVARRAIQQDEFARVIWLSTETLHQHTSVDKTNSLLFQTIINLLCRQIVPGGAQENNPARQLARVRNALKQNRYLIILDNLEDREATKQLLLQLNNLAGPSKFLLTSRHHPAPETEAYIFPLPELPLPEALSLLRYQAQIGSASGFAHLSDQELSDVYRVVGGHPLALRLIAHLARMYPLTQIMVGWQERRAGYIARQYQAVYETLWQTLNPEEKQLLQMMPLVAQLGGTIQQLQFVGGLSGTAFWPALTNLVELCLIEVRGTPQEPRYGIHSLTEHFLRGFWSEEGAAALHTKRIQTNITYWQQYLNELPAKRWSLLESERANIFRAIRFSLTLPAEAVTPTLKEHWQQLSEHLFRFVERHGYVNEWLPLLDALVEKFVDDVPTQCRLLNRLGVLYRLSYRLSQAIEIHQRVLARAHQAEIEELLARAHLNLGTDYYSEREFELAIRHAQTALDIFTRLGLTGRELAATFNRLGVIMQAQGDLTQSIEYLQQAAAIWRQRRSQAPELARTLNNLALVYQEQEITVEALACYTEAKHVLIGTGSELDRTLIYLSEGTLYFELGQYNAAEKSFKRIDLAYLIAADHLLYQALTLNNLGQATFKQGRHTQAENLLQESTSLWRKLENEIELANALSGLGDVYKAQEKLDLAAASCEEVVGLVNKYPDNAQANQLKHEALQSLAEINKRKEANR